jgi:hypothetical protein
MIDIDQRMRRRAAVKLLTKGRGAAESRRTSPICMSGCAHLPRVTTFSTALNALIASPPSVINSGMDEKRPAISGEGTIGIALTLIGLGGAGALFVLPHPYADYVGWSLIGIAVIGLIFLAAYHAKSRGWRKRFWAAIVVLLLCLSGGGYVAYHWPTNFLLSRGGNLPTPEGPTMSRLDHFILRCYMPAPQKTVNQTLADLSDYKQKLDVLGDALGVKYTMVTINSGVRLEVEAVTEEAKQRFRPLGGATKMTIEIRRIDQFEIVSAFVNLPSKFAFCGWIPPNPEAPDTINTIKAIENFLGVSHGTCQLV